MKTYQNYINGKWMDSLSKEKIQVEDPATTNIIGEIACAKNDDIDMAVDAAKKSFESRILVDMPILERAKLMRRIANETRKVAKEGGTLLCYENGKQINAGIKEFNDVADMFDYYAGLTDKLEGKTIPVSNSVSRLHCFRTLWCISTYNSMELPIINAWSIFSLLICNWKFYSN